MWVSWGSEHALLPVCWKKCSTDAKRGILQDHQPAADCGGGGGDGGVGRLERGARKHSA